MDKLNILILGTGAIVREYVKSLQRMNFTGAVTFVGNKPESVRWLHKSHFNFECRVYCGGLERFSHEPLAGENFSMAIVALPVDGLAKGALVAASLGVKRILIEKPGALYRTELEELIVASSRQGISFLVAYNRRYYDTVTKLGELLKKEKVLLVRVEASERAWTIPLEKFSPAVLDNWPLANTSHVLDLVFFLFGELTMLSHQTKIHSPVSRTICGIGSLGEESTPFVYSGCWDAPGGWAIEVCCVGKKFNLRPLERLTVEHVGEPESQVIVEESPGSKPGFDAMVQAFVQGEDGEHALPSVSDLPQYWNFYDLLGRKTKHSDTSRFN